MSMGFIQEGRKSCDALPVAFLSLGNKLFWKSKGSPDSVMAESFVCLLWWYFCLQSYRLFTEGHLIN